MQRHPDRVPVGVLVAGACALALVATAALAAGSNSIPDPIPDGPSFTPEQEAVLAYEQGLQLRDKAWEFEAEAAATTLDTDRDKAKKQAQKRYGRAMKEFQRATASNPQLFQAWSELGYSLRKLGQYDEALAAYGQALELEPGYTPAIEYRAEAHLELGRLAEVQEAYLILFRHDRARADQLMETIARWRESPGTNGPPSEDDLTAFLGWVDERVDVAKQTPALGELAARKW